jgi:hypothetical protein
MMCLWVSYKNKIFLKNIFFTSLKSLKKGVGSGVGSGFISQRYRSGSAPKCHGSPTLITALLWLNNITALLPPITKLIRNQEETVRYIKERSGT